MTFPRQFSDGSKPVLESIFKSLIFGGAFGNDGKTLKTYKNIMTDHEIVHYIHKLKK